MILWEKTPGRRPNHLSETVCRGTFGLATDGPELFVEGHGYIYY
jgi:hypothetical protein